MPEGCLDLPYPEDTNPFDAGGDRDPEDPTLPNQDDSIVETSTTRGYPGVRPVRN